jgi:hypothetical protein
MRLTLLTHDDRRLEADVDGYVCVSSEDTWMAVIDGDVPDEWADMPVQKVIGWEIVVTTNETTLSGTVVAADYKELTFEADQ